jgi:hypothetical protein
VALLTSPEQAKAMGEKGRSYVMRNRTYDVIANGVERELVRVAAGVPV